MKIKRSTMASLINEICGRSNSLLYNDEKGELSFQEYALLSNWIKKLQKNMPLSYILGFSEFFSRKFWVNSDVLIPRNESELLVEISVDEIKSISDRNNNKTLEILELGTGSGALIISIVLEIEKLNIKFNAHATDICSKALSVARNNANWLNAKVAFSQGNWFNNPRLTKKKFDLIIANPPYVGSEHRAFLSKSDISYEPKLAFYGTKISRNGLRDYEEILSGLKCKTKKGSLLIFEHGAMQRRQIINLLIEKGFDNFYTYNDLAGLDRVVKVLL
ncbi:MAG: protein-(glutamine-N5) methyltransferase, release factor-specific [Betaproteobacteria bacterium TMED156]|nr:MAG: protein-(glutamine-N5) methyltransferase, release factor-specific [Betaproteobacteria bacterium TMED156]